MSATDPLPARCPECGGGGFVIVIDADGERTVRCCRCDWRRMLNGEEDGDQEGNQEGDQGA